MFRETHETAIDSKLHDPRLRDLHRSHARVLRERSAAGDTGAPPLAALDADLLRELRGHLALVAPEGEDDFRYRCHGSLVGARMGLDLTGRLASTVRGEAGAFFLGCFRQVHRTGAALMTLHRATQAGDVHLWEQLLLPVRDADGTPACLAAMIPRELKSELLETIVAQSENGILAVRFNHAEDGRIDGGTIVHANPAAARLLRLPLETMAGTPARACCPGHDADGIWQRYLDVHAGRKAMRFVASSADSALLEDFDVAVSPLADGVLVVFSGIMPRPNAGRDVAGRMRRLEARIVELESELARRDLAALRAGGPGA
jgi:PAS domain-containing protein